ncbi:MAG TPA: hypothetical protein VN048_02470 [Verrucomicrobiae bacterium]|nr:hypothetical protein [Verrucomicrobiae bacterium]
MPAGKSGKSDEIEKSKLKEHHDTDHWSNRIRADLSSAGRGLWRSPVDFHGCEIVSQVKLAAVFSTGEADENRGQPDQAL